MNPFSSSFRRVRQICVLISSIVAAACASAQPEAIASAHLTVNQWGWVLVMIALAGTTAWFLRSRKTLSLKQLSSMTRRAECLLWEATMQLREGGWAWSFLIQPSLLTADLFNEDQPVRRSTIYVGYELPDAEAMDQGCREALKEGRSDYEIEFRIVRNGRTRWMRESVTIDDLGDNRFRLVGVSVETTDVRLAEDARRSADEKLQQLLSHVDCMVWQATVTRSDTGEMQWTFFVHPSELYVRLGGDRSRSERSMLWTRDSVPEYEEMEARSRNSILHGLPGYEQDFRVTLGSQLVWLHEKVSIQRRSENEWRLEGVAMDVSAQQLAKESRTVSELQLRQVVQTADFMLWHARVFQNASGALQWALTIPPARLYRRIFGRDPETRWPVMPWDKVVEPARRAEMADITSRAIINGDPGYEQQIRAQLGDETFWLQEQATITRVGPAEWQLVGVVTDVTAREQAEAAREASDRTLQDILSRADCLLWRATVVRAGSELKWVRFELPRSKLFPALFGVRESSAGAELWSLLDVPELPEMTRRSTTAILSGAPGYEQEFEATRDERRFWLNERVSIRRVNEDEWLLVGLVTDITERHNAEAARRQVETRLEQLLERVDCTIWQAEVTARPDGDFNWSIYIPRSRLYTRIFGCDPDDSGLFDWVGAQVPELNAMRAASRRAFLSGESGYEQVFHIPKPEGAIWLSEQTSVQRVDDGKWEVVGVITDITARREAELARVASEAQLEQILELADCMVWQANVSEREPGRFEWEMFVPRSALYRRLFGAAPRAGGFDWNEVSVPQIAEMDRRADHALMHHLPGYEQEFTAELPGGPVWLHEVVTIVQMPEGRRRLVGVVTDISVRRQAERAVQDSERRFRTLFQHAPVAIIEADFTRAGTWLDELRASGIEDLATWLAADDSRIVAAAKRVRVLDANEVAVKMLRARSLSDFSRRRQLLTTPGSLDTIRRVLLAIWQGQNTLEAELQMRDFEGHTHQMMMRWWTGMNGDRLDLHQSSMVFVDLTGLKQTEAELAAEKERLAVTLRAMAEGVITTDVDGVVQFMNAAASHLTGWTVSDAIGRSVLEVCVMENERTGDRLTVPVQRVAEGDHVADLPLQTRLAAGGGAWRMIRGCCAPIHAADSAVIGTVLVLRDVTEHERLEQELVRATRLESVGILAGGIAHDFNNILTAIMGNLALAQLDVEPASEAALSLRNAEVASLRARDLTQQLLTFAKGGEPVRAAIQLADILREMAGFALHGSRVKPVYEIGAELWPADADRGQISRVVQNLVINAVQAMPEGGTVRLAARNEHINGMDHASLSPGPYVRIEISDTGLGIKPEHIARIFDPYFTTKQAGSGLGLAAVYSIIRKHQGHIAVESQVGRGTTFRLWLPASADSVSTLSPATVPQTARMTGRLLFMDDEEVIRNMAATLLRRCGFDVTCAADGTEAVRLFRTAHESGQKFQLVIMDLTVPGGVGGKEAMALLREIDPAVRAIVSSGYSSDPVLANFRAYGFSGVVAKPYEYAELVRVLRDVLTGQAGKSTGSAPPFSPAQPIPRQN